VALRPEDVRLEPVAGEPSGLTGTLADLIYCGDHFEAAVRVGENEVVLEVPKEVRAERGQLVALRCDPGKVKTWPV
jgi:hypothetical protein